MADILKGKKFSENSVFLPENLLRVLSLLKISKMTSSTPVEFYSW